MPSINYQYYKKIRNKEMEMERSFSVIEDEYNDVNSGNYCNELILLLIDMNDFYKTYKSIETDVDHLLESQTLSTKQEDYKKIKENVTDKLEEIKSMYREIKSIKECGGGFTELEIETLSIFEIERII